MALIADRKEAGGAALRLGVKRLVTLLLEQRWVPDPQRHAAEAEAFGSERRLQMAPRDSRIDMLLLRRVWAVTRPYLARTRPGWTWVALALIVGLMIVGQGLWVWNTEVTKDLTNTVLGKQRDQVNALLMVLVGVWLLMSLASTLESLTNFNLQQHWRRWLIEHYGRLYLQNRTYHDITVRGDIDNPDQRIQEEAGQVVLNLLGLPLGWVRSALQISAGAFVLHGLSASLGAFAVAHALASAVVMFYVLRPTIRLNYLVSMAGADFRAGLRHVRDHAETVALYRGEAVEHRQIDARLRHLLRRNSLRVYYSYLVAAIGFGLDKAWELAPYLLVVPLFFRGEIDYGQIAQATLAAGAMHGGVSQLTKVLSSLAELAPSVVRLSELQERHDALDTAADETRPRTLTVHTALGVSASDFTLHTPEGERRLVRELSFRVVPGEPLAIVGTTGVGKSSLLRALAGLWTRAEGELTVPPSGSAVFLPQKPYMPQADLRQQVLYPQRAVPADDERVQQLLARVQLGELARNHGGLDAVKDWSSVLSLGEQQRLAIARVLHAAPAFAFLDEATSALDETAETAMYGLLAGAGITCISVGHRPAVVGFHTRVLHLRPEGHWRLLDARDWIGGRA